MRCIDSHKNRAEDSASRGLARPRGTLLARVNALWSALMLLIAAVSISLAACDKPKEADCKKAVANIRKIYGTAGTAFGATEQSMVRSCRGGASPESVKCFIQAKTIEDLHRCEGGAYDDMFGKDGEDGENKDKPQADGDKAGEAEPHPDGT